jgi:hypothetical protein
MRNILLVALTVAIGFMVACDDHDVLPGYKAPVIFNVTSSSLTHVRDTILSKGDTLKYRVIGYVSDSSRKYGISATLKVLDSVTQVQVGGNYFKTIAVKFDTVGSAANNGLFRWQPVDTNALYMTIPALPAKTKLRSSAVFAYGLNLSSQIGNTTASVSKNGYTK